jgi:undecaprenyl-phosphate 4-deoxy-4-formamido-L-arabinose transferase
MSVVAADAASTPVLSVVIPVYNEEESLTALFDRLYPALDKLQRSYEVIFIDDGSRDKSVAMLRAMFQKRPECTRLVILRGNFGQHAAIMAGFAHVRGQFIVTLDADLQNPPEEIGKLLVQFDAGYDYVGSIRVDRQDSLWRRKASAAMNRLRERMSRIKLTDQGCMLRGYDRSVIDALLQTNEVSTFIPALAYLYALKPTEIEVAHEARTQGESKYSLYKLIRLNFDLLTGFSLAPLQLFSMGGTIVSFLAACLFVLLVLRRLILGPEAEGIFTLFALVFFLIGLALFGIGLLGEYIGRIYLQVRQRPKYLVKAIVEQPPANGQSR